MPYIQCATKHLSMNSNHTNTYINTGNSWDASYAQRKSIYLQQVFVPGGLANARQREYFQSFVKSIIEITKDLSHQEQVMKCLRDLEWWYGSQGIGFGRSIRSVLAMSAIDGQLSEAYVKSHQYLAMLIALYYDREYMETHNWVDFSVGNAFPYLALSEIVNLTYIGLLMGINQLPIVSEESVQHTLRFAIDTSHEPHQFSLKV